MSEEEFPLTEDEHRKVTPSIIYASKACSKLIEDLYEESCNLISEHKSVYVVLALLVEINVEVFSKMLGRESSIEEVLDKFCDKLRELIIGG